MLGLGLETEVLGHRQGHTHMHILTMSMTVRMTVTMTERHHLSLVLLELLLLLLLMMMVEVVVKHMLRMRKTLDQVMLSTDRTNRQFHIRHRSSSSRSSALVPRPTTDDVPFQRDRAMNMVQLVVKPTGVAEDLAGVVFPPERGECCPAVCAHGLDIGTACG